MTETNAERLEEAKDAVERIIEYLIRQSVLLGVNDSDKNNLLWLIKQAERVPELEKSQQAWEGTCRNYVDENLSLKAENKRFSEALSFYAQHDNWWTYPVPGGYASAATVDNGRRARKELEESK